LCRANKECDVRETPALTTQLKELLERLQADGPIYVLEGDPWPLDSDLVAAGAKLGYIAGAIGHYGNPFDKIEITRAGQRALGIVIPENITERLQGVLRGFWWSLTGRTRPNDVK
jgi:hypothetical protein